MKNQTSFCPDYGADPFLVEMYESYLQQCKCEDQDDCCCAAFEKFCEEVIQGLRNDHETLISLEDEKCFTA